MPDIVVGSDGPVLDPARRITLPQLGTIVAVAAVLFVARDVFLPLSIAMLVTFALSPLVSRLRRIGLPMVATVLTVVGSASFGVALFFFVVIGQLATLAQTLPQYQANIIAKVDALQSSSGSDGILGRLTGMMGAISARITATVPGATGAAADGAGQAPAADAPMLVQVTEPRSVVQTLQDLVMPLVSPVAMTGLVVVLVIFMLLEREELRDRFIRLVGSNDLHRSTRVLEEAGQKVASYLLIQLLINVIYALPIGFGLWAIGVPYAPLWGLLTLVLRFVPYIGSVLSAAFPLFLAFAVAPGWSAVLWTAGLFAVVELITSNVVEPWLYGSRTGLTPLAIIVAAIFWTKIWGAPGLVLSTPLTVCLVVLGRHIPQFELFDILLGDEPVLSPSARLYQRLLAGDATEATRRAEGALEEDFLSDYYQDVAIPALLLAQSDHARGVLTADREARLADTAMSMVEDLRTVMQDERDSDTPQTDSAPATADDATKGAGVRLICIGGRTRLDDVAAAMLAQAAEARGGEARTHAHDDLAPLRLANLDPASTDCLILGFLDPAPSRASLLHVRRLKRAVPGLRVGVVIWQMPAPEADALDPMQPVIPPDPERLAMALAIGADFAVGDIDTALREALSGDAVRPLTDRLRPARPRLVKPKAPESVAV